MQSKPTTAEPSEGVPCVRGGRPGPQMLPLDHGEKAGRTANVVFKTCWRAVAGARAEGPGNQRREARPGRLMQGPFPSRGHVPPPGTGDACGPHGLGSGQGKRVQILPPVLQAHSPPWNACRVVGAGDRALEGTAARSVTPPGVSWLQGSKGPQRKRPASVPCLNML